MGKTSLARRCVQHQIVTQSDPSRIDVSLLSVQRQGGSILQLHLWDIPSVESQKQRTPILYANARVCLIVVDVSAAASFGKTSSSAYGLFLIHHNPTKDEAVLWKKDVDRRNMGLSCVLIANKSDLAATRGVVDRVDTFARQHGFGAWFKTSAKENVGLQDVLRYIVNQTQE